MTIILSRIIFGESINKIDKIVMFISVIGVSVIYVGKFESETTSKITKVSTPILAVIGLISIPILNAGGAINNR